jgi:hypothetical protein
VSSSRGVRLLFRARLRRIRPFPFSGPARFRSPDRSRDSGPPLLGFLLPSKRNYVGYPCSPERHEAVREDEGRQTLVGAVLRVLAPLDGSGCARGTARALASSPLRRGTPTLRSLVTCCSRLFGAALQSFPFPRSRTCSRRPLLPCGFASDYRQRDMIESFTVAFPAAPALCP